MYIIISLPGADSVCVSQALNHSGAGGAPIRRFGELATHWSLVHLARKVYIQRGAAVEILRHEWRMDAPSGNY